MEFPLADGDWSAQFDVVLFLLHWNDQWSVVVLHMGPSPILVFVSTSKTSLPLVKLPAQMRAFLNENYQRHHSSKANHYPAIHFRRHTVSTNGPPPCDLH